jgi:valyl-tRNA synthetase
MWNIARFISMFDPIKAPVEDLQPADIWIIAELKQLIEASLIGYQQYNFFIPATRARSFIRDVFASHYLEMVKYRAYEGSPSAIFALHFVLKSLLQLLAPIIPFATDLIHRRIYQESVHSFPFPTIDIPIDSKMLSVTEELLAFNSKVWKAKKEQGLALNAEISSIEIPATLRNFKIDLEAMHRIV